MSEFRANIVATLDTSKIPSDIKKIENQKVTLNNITLNTKGLAAKIQSALSGTKFTLNLSDVKINTNQITGKVGGAVQKNVQSQLDKIKFNLNTGGFEAKISSVMQKVNALNGVTPQLQSNLNALKAAFDTMNSSSASEAERLAAYQQFNSLLPVITNQVNNLASAERQQAQATSQAAKAQEQFAQNSNKAAKMLADVETFMKRNPKAAKEFGSELASIKARLQEAKAAGTSVGTIGTEFAKIKAEAQAAGLTVNTFATSFKNLSLQVLGLGSAYQIAMKIINAVKQGVNTVVDLDEALIDLKKTTTMSNNDLEQFYYDANKQAKELGVTTKDIIQSAADWSRLGYSDKQSATMMARYAAQFATISPGMDIQQATTGLVSIMKAYGIETEEVLDGVMSKINRVGNTAATSNAQIINGLQNSASALAAMGTSLDKSIALFTAAQEIAQDDSKVGNALRSISLRIRGYDEETEQLSEDLVNITGDVINLTKVASNNYKGVSLFTDATQTEYKDIYDYLEGISEIWDELDAKTRQTLMEKLFGKNRANIIDQYLPLYTEMCA